MGTPNGAELLVDCLVRAGITTIFGVPGDTGVVLYDALYHRHDEIRHVLARDERHAAAMADGYARAAGTVGAVEVSSGGGVSYVIGGLGEAYAASVPVLVISSDIHAASRNTGALTEIDQRALFAAVTKWRAVAESAEQLPALVADALRQATSGRPAPVALIVPENVLDEAVPAPHADAANAAATGPRELTPQARLVPRDRPAAEDASVRRAAELLTSAHRPAIVAGSGVHLSGAWDELAGLAEAAAVPVATTIHGKGAISDTSPWSLGVVGANGGGERANSYLGRADVVLFVGTRANATDTNGWTAPGRDGVRVIQVDVEAARAGRNFPGSLGLVGDAGAVLGQLRAQLRETGGARGSGVLNGQPPAAARDVADLDDLDDLDEAARPERLRASDVVRVAHSALGGEGTVVADPGTPTPNVAAHWVSRAPGRNVLVPRGHGPMGYAIPAGVGAALARPDDTVLVLTTDGSLAMAGGELETIQRLGLPIICLQLTNFSLGWIKMLQHLYTDRRYFGVDPGPIDAVLMAQANGLEAVRAGSLGELRTTIKEAAAARRPVYIDAYVHHMIDDVPEVAPWHAALAGDTARPTY